MSFLYSCMPQSKYSYQEPELPESFRVLDNDTKEDTDSISIGTINWEDYFKEPELIELINKGLQFNFDMQQALKTIEIANQYSKSAKLEWLPDLNATVAGAAYEFRSEEFYSNPNAKWYDNTGTTPPNSMYMYKPQNYSSLNLSWEIDIWGKMRSKKAAALYELSKNEEVRKAVQTKIVSEIAEGYYSLLLLYEQLRVAQQNYQLSQNTYNIIKLQYESGNVTALAKQQTKSQMLSYSALIPKLKQEIALQENNLNFLVGGLPEEIERKNTTLWSVQIDSTISYGVPLGMVDNRPDVNAKKLDLLKKNAEVGVAQVAQYPQLKIDLDFGVNSMIMRNWLNIPGALFGNIIGNLTQPIFNKRKLKTEFEVAKLNREKSEIDFQRTVYYAVKEVSDALITINSLQEQFDIIEEQVKTTELAIRQAAMLFNSGYASYLEVITAQRDALDSELRYNEIRHELLIARIRLYRALGGGWH